MKKVFFKLHTGTATHNLVIKSLTYKGRVNGELQEIIFNTIKTQSFDNIVYLTIILF